ASSASASGSLNPPLGVFQILGVLPTKYGRNVHPVIFPCDSRDRRRLVAYARCREENSGMAGDESNAPSSSRLSLMLRVLDGSRPSGTLGWVSPIAPVIPQAAVGARHWAAGRRQRALAAWASAAGFGRVAWGLGSEAPTRAEAQAYL